MNCVVSSPPKRTNANQYKPMPTNENNTNQCKAIQNNDTNANQCKPSKTNAIHPLDPRAGRRRAAREGNTWYTSDMRLTVSVPKMVPAHMLNKRCVLNLQFSSRGTFRLVFSRKKTCALASQGCRLSYDAKNMCDVATCHRKACRLVSHGGLFP